jgi:HK97 family phage portal protein
MRLTLRERLFGRVESRSLPPAENQLPLLPSYTGSHVNTSNALVIGDVWACVRVLADAASSLPLHVYREIEDGRERVRSGRLVELLDRPGPGVTQADLISSLMAHLAIFGNGYVAKFREAGEIVQLGLLAPDRVRPELIGGQLRFRYQPGTGPDQMLSTRDVVHVKGLSVDGLVGLSAVSQAARVLGLSDELVKHAQAFFRNDLMPSGVLKLGDPTSEQVERVRQLWTEKHTGEQWPGNLTHNAHRIAIIGGGPEVDFKPISVDPDRAQFHEQRELAAREVARCFRVPPHMVAAASADSMTYSNVEQESLHFVRYSLQPWLRRIELAVSHDRDLTSERQYAKFELDGLLRSDAKSRAEIYHLGLDPVQGWLDVDEVRRWEDLPPRAARPPTPSSNGAGAPENVPAVA